MRVSIFDSEHVARAIKGCCVDFRVSLMLGKFSVIADCGEFLGYAFDTSWSANSWIDFCPHCGTELPCNGATWGEL